MQLHLMFLRGKVVRVQQQVFSIEGCITDSTKTANRLSSFYLRSVKANYIPPSLLYVQFFAIPVTAVQEQRGKQFDTFFSRINYYFASSFRRIHLSSRLVIHRPARRNKSPTSLALGNGWATTDDNFPSSRQ